MPKEQHINDLQFYHPDIITFGADSPLPFLGFIELRISSISCSLLGVFFSINMQTHPHTCVSFLWAEVIMLTGWRPAP